MDPECPVCQGYTRTLKELYEKYQTQGVEFRAVYPTYTLKKKDIRRFHGSYQLPFAGQKDKGAALADRFDATVTPEAILTDPLGRIIYRGAIDNWYYALGKNRPAVTEHYLRDALEATLQGQPVLPARTQAVGCLINR
ncbi:hypothetical protein GCM10027275_08010 [Rhabdobacter roseus]